MRILASPNFTADGVYDLALSSISDAGASARLTASRTDVVTAIAAYETACASKSWFSLPTQRDLGTALNADFKALYKAGMVAANGGARSVYVAIRKLAKRGTCPLCGVNVVAGLDHYLPQSRYAAFVVFPKNLIPCCSDCNRFKLAKVPKAVSEQTIHPYYDNYTAEQWLHADLEEADPPAIGFKVTAPDHWDDDDKGRVVRHFTTFKLADLYASNAANELINMRGALQEIAAAGTAADVQAELARRFRSYRAAHVNSWQTALYDCLARSVWFCEGGFELVEE